MVVRHLKAIERKCFFLRSGNQKVMHQKVVFLMRIKKRVQLLTPYSIMVYKKKTFFTPDCNNCSANRNGIAYTPHIHLDYQRFSLTKGFFSTEHCVTKQQNARRKK